MTGFMETDTSGRPFESLEWYRAAVRADERDPPGIMSWLKGIGFLSAHISVFAVGIVALLIINLLRSPQDLWVDRAGAAWAMLLTIHAVAIGLVWAIGLLGKDDHQALQIVPDAEWRRPSASWPQAASSVPATATSPGEIPAPASGKADTAVQPARPEAPPSDGHRTQPVPPGWSSWGQEAERPPASDEPRVSWKEAASWLARTTRTRRSPVTDRRDGSRSDGAPPP